MGSRRVIWARGLTPNEVGRRVTVNGGDVFLKGVEHFDGRTVLTYMTSVEVACDSEVTVHE